MRENGMNGRYRLHWPRRGVVLLVTAGCLFVASTIVDWYGKARSETPWDSIAVKLDGEHFWTRRGGGELRQRHLRPITEAQYRIRCLSDSIQTLIVLPGLGCFFAGLIWTILVNIRACRERYYRRGTPAEPTQSE